MSNQLCICKPSLDMLMAFAPYMAEEDKQECWDFGYSPEVALTMGYELEGECRAVLDLSQPIILGAYGIIKEDQRIWSLWRDDLTIPESKWIIRKTREEVPSMLRALEIDSAFNEVSLSNERSKKWIEASGCFFWCVPNGYPKHNGRPYVPFRTKPLSKLDKLCADH